MSPFETGANHQIQVKDPGDVYPVCPHCDSEVRQVYQRQVKTQFGKSYIFYCSNCRKVLGVTHRKGFWMG
ncbi:MAG: hypothetical protein RB296_02755 [Acidobacteriota bacterium]|jgi:uncharacterized protein with PIN domain|nr:hypothetical protein [Acidobacteriota bacterium]